MANIKFTNAEIAELLRDVAASYQLKDLPARPAGGPAGRQGRTANKFKIIAYQKAADAVEHASSELKDLWDDGKLGDIPGVGPSIAEHLSELFERGSSRHFKEIMKGLPPAMFELMKVPGIGAKRAYRLTTELGAGSVQDLEKIAKEGKIARLEGFGEESQTAILSSIQDYKNKGSEKRLILPYAMHIAEEIMEWMLKNPHVKKIDTLGSLRRRASTIGDIDLAAATNKPTEVLAHFTNFPNKTRVLEKGDRTASIVLPSGVQVDLMVEKPEAYGALLQHFTGSKHHNVSLRTYALKMGLSLSDYGIKKISKTKNSKLKSQNYNSKLKIYEIPTEEKFYEILGMDFVPPELREDSGEIQAALEHKLPELIELRDIKGDLQIHSDFDIETSHDLGESSMEEIIEKASEIRYEYLAFTEHNPSRSKHNDQEIIDILKRKREKVDKINYSLKNDKNKGIKYVFNSLEIDIMPDGRLPVPEKGLHSLDFGLVSIHGSFKLSRQAMTKRVLSALSHPKVKIFAHPTARKLGFREGVDLDWPEIFDFAKRNNKWIEINAEPMRLDLPDMLVRDAVKLGVKLTMGTDSHHKDSMENMQYGISVARRGWATKKDIVNTRTLKEFNKLLENE